jgi:hypothetical protein
MSPALYTYFRNDDDTVLLSCNLPSAISPGTFDRDAFTEALVSLPSVCVH